MPQISGEFPLHLAQSCHPIQPSNMYVGGEGAVYFHNNDAGPTEQFGNGQLASCHPIQPPNMYGGGDGAIYFHNNDAGPTEQFGDGQLAVIPTQTVPRPFHSFPIAQSIQATSDSHTKNPSGSRSPSELVVGPSAWAQNGSPSAAASSATDASSHSLVVSQPPEHLPFRSLTSTTQAYIALGPCPSSSHSVYNNIGAQLPHTIKRINRFPASLACRMGKVDTAICVLCGRLYI
ncbi:hypothetical protein B0H13DRAFT_2305839 [Mycena leptocephala]|nr:hypothetical protein B0H13DRAFT_2305839 [Mycena leptocephala]